MQDHKTLEAHFAIDSWEEVSYDEPQEGPKLTRPEGDVERALYDVRATGHVATLRKDLNIG